MGGEAKARRKAYKQKKKKKKKARMAVDAGR
jgi:hypothetical protein